MLWQLYVRWSYELSDVTRKILKFRCIFDSLWRSNDSFALWMTEIVIRFEKTLRNKYVFHYLSGRGRLFLQPCGIELPRGKSPNYTNLWMSLLELCVVSWWEIIIITRLENPIGARIYCLGKFPRVVQLMVLVLMTILI